MGDSGSDSASENEQQPRLHKQLAEHAAAARAQRSPDRQLMDTLEGKNVNEIPMPTSEQGR
jgi:hypothetical protein